MRWHWVGWGLPAAPAERNTSIEVIRRMMAAEMPAVPRIGFAVVDMPDVAIAHRIATAIPEAAGNRYICAGEHMRMDEMAAILPAEFGPQGYRIPARPLPHWLMWTIARFDKTIRLARGLRRRAGAGQR